MSAPTPESRNYGRGRGKKEMTSSERVTNWVNQREARRLNKERWSGIGTKDCPQSEVGKSRASDENMSEQDQLTSEKQNQKKSSKTPGAALYVPPWMRKRSSPTSSNSCNSFHQMPSSSQESPLLTECLPQNNVKQSENDAKPMSNVKEDNQSLDSNPEPEKPRSKGRGRRKPEVQLYRPRALRESQEKTKPQQQPKLKDSLLTEAGDNFSNSDITTENHTNIIDDSSPINMSFNSVTDAVSDYSKCSEIFDGNKLKNSSLNVISSEIGPDYNSSNSNDFAGSNSMPSPVDNMTFEFYDPAVIAFMPSPERVGESFSFASTPNVPICSDGVATKSNVNSSFRETSCGSAIEVKFFHNIPDEGSISNVRNSVYLTNSMSTENGLTSNFEISDENFHSAEESFITEDSGFREKIEPECCPDKNISQTEIIQNSLETQLNIQKSLPSEIEVISANKVLESQESTVSNDLVADYQPIVSKTDINAENNNPNQQVLEILLTTDTVDKMDIPKMSSLDMDVESIQNDVVLANDESLTEKDRIEKDIQAEKIMYVENMHRFEKNEKENMEDINKSEVKNKHFIENSKDVIIDKDNDSNAEQTLIDVCSTSKRSKISKKSTDSKKSKKKIRSDKESDKSSKKSSVSDKDSEKSKSIEKTSEKSSVLEKDSDKCKSKKTLSSKLDKPSGDNDEYEDSWDALFDDNGDCLNETELEELTDFVGKVKIDKPKINYLKYQPKEPDFEYEAFSHIVEIYDFPPELATCDLISAFREFASRGFDVKWVDDTHALGIFSSTIAANEALNLNNPLLKVRPLSQGSKKGQSKARQCQEFLQPYKARPETTSLAARRLVAGALGMAPKVSKEIRDAEKQKLKEAKDKRRQTRQQKIDIWDGSFGKCAMDDE